MANTKPAENALRAFLKASREGGNLAKAAANFKLAVNAYNAAKNAAAKNPTPSALEKLRNRIIGVKKAATKAQEVTSRMKGARRQGLISTSTGPETVKIGNKNFNVTRNKNGKITGVSPSGNTMTKYHMFETQNGKNYVQLENGTWYRLGNTSSTKYNKNKKNGKFKQRPGFFGRLGGAAAGAARGVGGALGGLVKRGPAKPVNPNSETASLLQSTNKIPNK